MDKGYETITLNKSNYLNSPRLIASRVNETNNAVIQNFSGDRSFASFMLRCMCSISPISASSAVEVGIKKVVIATNINAHAMLESLLFTIQLICCWFNYFR